MIKHVGSANPVHANPNPNPNNGSNGGPITSPITHPDTPKDAGAPIQRPPGDDCDDPPCIKTVVPGLRKCTKNTDCPQGLNCTDGVCK